MSILNVDTISDAAGSGKPDFPNGLTGDGSSLSGISAYKPIAVTGTTPSLDVGAYTFFNQGATTADTTISFASVPTDAKWQYSFVATEDPATSSNLSGAKYNLDFFTLTPEGNTPVAVAMKPDGLNMFYMDSNSGRVFQYVLTEAFNLSTASYTGLSFATNAQNGQPFGMVFKTDGTSMYTMDRSSDRIYQYDLSTAWNVSTATYSNKSMSTVSQNNNPFGMTSSVDGTKMYMVGTGGSTPIIYQYNLSTAYDISTGSFSGNSFTLTGTNSSPDASFSEDGLTLFSISAGDDTVRQYTASTAYDVSTLSNDSATFNLEVLDTDPQGIAIINNGKSFLIVGDSSDKVYKIDVAKPYNITLPASVVGSQRTFETSNIDGNITYTFITNNGGTKVSLIADDHVNA